MSCVAVVYTSLRSFEAKTLEKKLHAVIVVIIVRSFKVGILQIFSVCRVLSYPPTYCRSKGEKESFENFSVVCIVIVSTSVHFFKVGIFETSVRRLLSFLPTSDGFRQKPLKTSSYIVCRVHQRPFLQGRNSFNLLCLLSVVVSANVQSFKVESVENFSVCYVLSSGPQMSIPAS